MAAAPPSFRFSNGQITTADAVKDFPWEAPVPVNRFWDSFDYCNARNFLVHFSDEDLKQLPINQESSDDHREKNKLAEEEAATSPPQSLYKTNYKRWYGLWQGIYTYQDQLNLPEAEDTVRMLVRTRPDESNVVPPHMLAAHFVKIGNFEEAEETERPVLKWMDERPSLGKELPQAINARRIIEQALWFQGPSRRHEAETLVAEIHTITDGMGEGKFGIYQEEEKQLNQEMVSKLV
ncbi:hypothetical protein BX600DRAFT_537730 [Xylariales sp. PMI_506]|nr:hypothetical protein BX600DRAFT_537730 [Xylariales sp. PMI_506]